MKQLQRQLEMTKQELVAEKNKSVITHQLLGTNQLQLGTVIGTVSLCVVCVCCLGQGDDHITSQKIATLEMKVCVIVIHTAITYGGYKDYNNGLLSSQLLHYKFTIHINGEGN